MSERTGLAKIYLADDDEDDCLLFEEALSEISANVDLTIANDGSQLMNKLKNATASLPDLIFLDLNMPSKNGFECLVEIRNNPALQQIPIVIFSTSANPDTINKVYEQGANKYICKPGTFFLLKKAIGHVLSASWKEQLARPSKENFILRLN